MKIGAMIQPARDPVSEIKWIGQNKLEVFAPERAYLLQNRHLLRLWWEAVQ